MFDLPFIDIVNLDKEKGDGETDQGSMKAEKGKGRCGDYDQGSLKAEKGNGRCGDYDIGRFKGEKGKGRLRD